MFFGIVFLTKNTLIMTLKVRFAGNLGVAQLRAVIKSLGFAPSNVHFRLGARG